MKIVKTASGKQAIKLSKKEWQSIGKKAGWMRESGDIIQFPDSFQKYENSDEVAFSDKELIHYQDIMDFMEDIDKYRFYKGMKDVYKMRYFEEMSIPNISERTGRSEESVKSFIIRLLKELLPQKFN